MPHPKTDFSKNQNASRRILPWPKSTKRFFSESRLTFWTIWGQGTPFFRNEQRKCAASTVERVTRKSSGGF